MKKIIIFYGSYGGGHLSAARNIKEYIEILDNKSQRLKKLIEDLVEASKISTGNISLNLENINIVMKILKEFSSNKNIPSSIAYGKSFLETDL